jgi:hypothetical protein
VGLTCPNCGNARNFLVKTLQMHVVQLDDSRVEVSEESKPGVIEVLCDECETQGSAPHARRALGVAALGFFEVITLHTHPLAHRHLDFLLGAGQP